MINYTLSTIALIVQLNILAFSQDSTQLSGLPTIYTVHIDEVMPSSMQRFEQLNTAQTRSQHTILEEYNLPLTPVYELSTSSGMYMSLRAKTLYGDLDKPLQYPDDIKKLFAEKVSPYSDTIHTLLRYHHNEIWKLDGSGSYIPKSFSPNPSATKFLHLRSEWVKPPMNATYDSILTLFRQALDKQKYPLACIVLYSQYGTGANHYLWHARNQAEYVKSPSPDQVLISAYGKEEGTRLYQQWQQCLFKVDDFDMEVRPDLTDLRKDQPWFVITK
jgi:hypothetical protein